MRYPQGLRAFFLGSPLVRSGLRILDAGCGTGALTLAVRDAFVRRGCAPKTLHAFDLTPAMLDRLRETLRRRGIKGVELAEANVLQLDGLPASWRDYDLVVSASMLEYVPRDRFVDALAGLRARVKEGGSFVLFMTRRNPLTRLLIGRWWASNLYTVGELADAFQRAGFSTSPSEASRRPPATSRCGGTSSRRPAECRVRNGHGASGHEPGPSSESQPPRCDPQLLTISRGELRSAPSPRYKRLISCPRKRRSDWSAAVSASASAIRVYISHGMPSASRTQNLSAFA